MLITKLYDDLQLTAVSGSRALPVTPGLLQSLRGSWWSANVAVNGWGTNLQLMVASYLGGLSIAYSQVGVAHALSYGLSFVLGTRHGIGNCIVFDQIEEYYPEDVVEFRQMLKKNGILLPKGLCANLTETQMNEMVRVALSLGPLWENALGPDWKVKMTPEKCRELYQRM